MKRKTKRFSTKEYPQMTQERLVLRIEHLLCRIKIAEEQIQYLYELISEKVPEEVARNISFKLDEIFIKHDEAYCEKTNEQALADYAKESAPNMFFLENQEE